METNQLSILTSEEEIKFINDLKSGITNKLSKKKPSECIEIITISPTGRSARWRPTDGEPFFSRFWSFLWNKPFEESGIIYQLDSGLTEEIIEEVTYCYEKLIERNQDAIVNLVIGEIIIKESIRAIIVDDLIKSNSGVKIINAETKRIIGNILLSAFHDKLCETGSHISSSISEKINSLLIYSISNEVGKQATIAVAKAVSIGVGKVIITKLSIIIAKSLMPILAKLLAKPLITVMLKKIAVVGIIGSIAKIFAVKIGIGISAAIWIILIPIIIIWLYHDYKNFPKKLGEDLSESIAKKIRPGLKKHISEIINNLILEFTSDKMVKEFAKTLINDDAISANITTILRGMK